MSSNPNEKIPVQSQDADGEPSDSKRPKNVPSRLWEKFQALEKRTNEVTKRSTEKRIKHLQRTVLDNVARALHREEDKEIVGVPPLLNESQKGSLAASTSSSTDGSLTASRPRKRPAGEDTTREDHDEKSVDRSPLTVEKQWQEVRGLLGVNGHLAGVSHGSLGPKTVLEVRIDDAIKRGDYRGAEELSDHMASREFGEKVAHAIDAKNFLQHKQEEEEKAKARRKKKLNWGFEAKHRWETKSNM